MFARTDLARRVTALGAFLGCFSLVAAASAQDEAPAEPGAPAAEPPASPPEDTMDLGEQNPDEAAVVDALDTGPVEKPGKQYLFVGARYRAVIVPTFIQGLFADGGETLVSHTPGLEFGIRKDAFEYNLFLQMGIYSASDVPFKGSSDDNTAWEILDFDYNLFFLGSDFMWSTDEFAPGLSMTYGAGVGLGLVTGELIRTQAHPASRGQEGDPDSYTRCTDVGQPSNWADFCGDDNDHYNGYVEPSWADGGSSPLIFPWIAGQIGLRHKVSRNFVYRIEIGVMPTGAFAGVGADYGL